MIRVIGLEAMLHISFSLAAFVFSVVLFILVCALGTGQVHRNLTFRTLTVIIVLGNLLSMLDNIFRDAGIFPTPYWIQLLLLLLVYVANILLTYYMASYMEGFFDDFALKDRFHIINSFLVFSALLFTLIFYLRQLLCFKGDAILNTVPIWVRVLLGYVYELYFLVYTLVLFIAFSKKLSRRARYTSVAAFTVVIGSVLFELVNTFGIGSGILYNYFGAVIGLYIFYIGVETPDYRNLLQSMTDLDTARQAADEANRSKSDFLANMSHEIRTPINGVLGMNEMILREAEDKNILTYAENIRNAGNILLGLINDILDFSKIEAGRIEIIPADYDLATVINDLINIIQTRADAKGLLLNLDFDRSMPKHLNGDEVRVKQVITNILTNAVKYTEKGSVTFSIGYEKLEDDPDSVLLKVAVKDTGIGIKEEDLPKLFSEFERIEEKRNRNIEGTGLGMSITKSLLKLMGSTLEVESVYGVGSTFSFSLKQKVVSWDELGNYETAYQAHLDEHSRYQEKFTAPDVRILVVDDNQMNLLVFRSLLKQTLITVDTACDGDTGLRLAGENKYDLIFLDHMMPGKDGIETLHELRQKETGPNVNTPAICLTANAISGAREKYIDVGFESYISKPINTNELEKLFLEYLPKSKIKEPAEGSCAMPLQPLSVPEDLKSLTEYSLDVASAIEKSGCVDVYRSLLKVFYETTDERSRELDRYREEADFRSYTTLVHSLKSSLRIIGAADLGEEAQKLEDAGKKEDGEYINRYHDGFLDRYIKLKEPLAALFDTQEDGDKEEADEDRMAKAYERIRNAAEDLDYDSLSAVFEEMSSYRIPSKDRELWDKLREACDQFEYDDILSMLNAPINTVSI
jgi:signal transduction histidine kinase/DNA-binding NarL/FixJ family response regulator